MSRIRQLLRLPALVLALACGGGDAEPAADTLPTPAVLPGDTLAVPPAMTSDSAAGVKAAAPPAGAGQAAPSSGSGAAPGTKAGASGGTTKGAMTSGELTAVAGAAQQGAGGLQVMPWENLVPLVIADLRAHVQRQERTFARTKRYSSSPPPLGVSARDGWTTRIVHAGPRGWSAVATQTFYPGRSCVIWVGASAEEARAPRTEAAGLRGDEGEPVCDPAPTR